MTSFHRRKSRVTIKNSRIQNMHYVIAAGFILFIGFGVLIQAFRWQIVQGDKFANLAKAQYLESTDQSTTRGIIYANDDTVLAVDEPVWDVYASLSSLPAERELFFEHKDEYVATVAGILAMEKVSIDKKLVEDFMYVKLKENIDIDKKKALESALIFPTKFEGYHKSFGFHFVKHEDRVYPNGKLASHLLGFIGKNSEGTDVGQYGIEGFYFSDILGQNGYTYEEKDSLGNVILTSEYDPILPRQGKSFKLTVNPVMQLKVEKILKKRVIEQQAKSGSVVIMDPNTGGILAMANYPDYNPNEYWKVGENWIFRNKAVADVYEYGSVQKPITEAIALESGNVKEDYTCNDKTGSFKLYDKTIYTWNKLPSGKINLSGILEKSNNPCIAQVALEAGHVYFYPKLGEFGIGRFVGIGLQDEATGYLKPFEEWTKLDLATTAFGQSVAATPLQVISAISTIANEGIRMRPYLISEVKEAEEVIDIKPQVIATPISAKTAKIVSKNMENVVRKGEPRSVFNSLLPDYSIAGKTGTAQIPKKDGPGYYDDRVNATFVGFSPVQEAKMVMLVRIEEPKTSAFAVTTAVPVWIEIYKAIADDLEIAKTR